MHIEFLIARIIFRNHYSSMSGAYSTVDASGSFLANVILKKGRNEVQIYSISSENGPILVENSTKRHELEIDQSITAVTWFNDQPKSKKSGKRNHDAESNGNGNSHATASSHLAVVLASGEIWVFSPFSDSKINVISNVEKLVSLSSSSNDNCFWGLTETGLVVEINSIDNSTTRSFKFKNDSDITLVHSLRHTKGNHLLLASSTLYLVDGAKSKKQLVTEFPSEKTTIAFVQQVADNLILVARENSSLISLYNISEPLAVKNFECSGPVTGLAAIGDAFIALTHKGADVFETDGKVACIKTNSSKVAFENVFKTATGVIGVWFDANQPRFARIEDFNTAIDIDYSRNEETEEKEGSPDITLAAVDSTEISNMTPNDLLSELSALLTSKKVLKKSVLKLCSSNDDEDNIKEAIRLFSYSESCSVLVDKLFEIVSVKVLSDPTKKSTLSIWLKWLLLVHGGYISRQPTLSSNLKALQTSLDEGMKMMPRLLALQGRLQLLKSQAELRSKINQPEEYSEGETELEAFNETFNNTTNVEESIVYANGENDDFDSIDKDDEEIVNGTVFEDDEA